MAHYRRQRRRREKELKALRGRLNGPSAVPPPVCPPGCQYAWFSKNAADDHGYGQYLNRKGKIVDVVEVSDDPVTCMWRWGDVIFVGFIRKRNWRGRVECGDERNETTYYQGMAENHRVPNYGGGYLHHKFPDLVPPQQNHFKAKMKRWEKKPKFDSRIHAA